MRLAYVRHNGKSTPVQLCPRRRFSGTKSFSRGLASIHESTWTQSQPTVAFSSAELLVRQEDKSQEFQDGIAQPRGARRSSIGYVRLKHVASHVGKQRAATGETAEGRVTRKVVSNSTTGASKTRFAAEPALESKDQAWKSPMEQMAQGQGAGAIHAAWEEVRTRQLALPIHDRRSGSLLALFATQPTLWGEIFQYASDLRSSTGKTYRSLYGLIVAKTLSGQYGQPVSAFLDWHDMFLKEYWVPSDALKKLVRHAVRSQDSLEAFRLAYICSEPRHWCVYDTLITSILQRYPNTAHQWHDLLISHNDVPSKRFLRNPAFQDFAATVDFPSASELHPTSVPLKSNERSSSHDNLSLQRVRKVRSLGLRVNTWRDRIQGLTGRHQKVPAWEGKREQKQLSDHLCARIVATNAIGIDGITTGLQMLGVNSVGPLALRQLCLQAGQPEAIREHLKKLKDAGIEPDSSYLCRAIMKLVKDNSWSLLEWFVKTEQHHDILGDTKIQMNLLRAHIARHDHNSANQVLQVLTVLDDEPETQSWNILLRIHAENRDYDNLSRTFHEMEGLAVPVSFQTTLDVAELCLPAQPSSGIAASCKNSEGASIKQWLGLVAKMYLKSAEAGIWLGPALWTELLKRFGTYGYLEELEILSLSFLRIYGVISERRTGLAKPSNNSALTTEQTSAELMRRLSTAANLDKQQQFGPSHSDVNKVFTGELLAAMIHCGFARGLVQVANKLRASPHQKHGVGGIESASFNRKTRLPPLARTYLSGLVAAQRLAERLEAPVRRKVAVAARIVVRQWLWTLFCPRRGHSQQNRQARKANPYTLYELLLAVRAIWRGPLPLFPEIERPMHQYRQALVSLGMLGNAAPCTTALKEMMKKSRQRQPKMYLLVLKRWRSELFQAMFSQRRKPVQRRAARKRSVKVRYIRR